MSIDWSKAPDGANKAGFTGHDQYLQFYRIPGMFGDYDYWSEKRGWCGNDFPTCANHLFDRPEKVEWDGQGLPPVGIECETWHVYQPDDITIRKILFMGSSLVVMSDKFRGEVTGRLEKVQFRPIRTPEQIAAEEREKAIEEMCFAEETLTVKQAKALYEAGYRRQESST
ncbi:hypothetical protein N0070_19850 [Pseudomonas aeruginosa]|nr:hypothetical protein [Pseudomonas aeruginosa]MCS7618455.1 hypothetical protein [Pseudomonas aeruginosa]MCS9911556.1 hypothetical protein [Pseudomonas aeruginosa]